jgi:hypothetical protein
MGDIERDLPAGGCRLFVTCIAAIEVATARAAPIHKYPPIAVNMYQYDMPITAANELPTNKLRG